MHGHLDVKIYHKYLFLQDVSQEFLVSHEHVLFCHFWFWQQLVKRNLLTAICDNK